MTSNAGNSNPSSATADELAKSVCGHIARALDKGGGTPTLLAERKDFVAVDRPITSDPIEMAAAAFVHLAILDDGVDAKWMDILAGVMAFLVARHLATPPAAKFKALRDLVLASPADSAAISNWFRMSYCDPAV